MQKLDIVKGSKILNERKDFLIRNKVIPVNPNVYDNLNEEGILQNTLKEEQRKREDFITEL